VPKASAESYRTPEFYLPGNAAGETCAEENEGSVVEVEFFFNSESSA